ncbi:MAG TPA: hypothetical protein DCS21_11070 [Gammaproteobacteria bacterium]|nr:hypothetical protein [Gammaproteobacteria bacterium]
MTCHCTPELPAIPARLRTTCSPFLHGKLDTILDIQDALDHAQASIALWADLFTGKADHHDVLNTDQARHGMYLQLSALGNTLAVISDALETLKNPTPRNG